MKRILAAAFAIMMIGGISAQESTNSGVRMRQPGAKQQEQAAPGVSDRMKSRFGTEDSSLSEGDMQWMRVIYRQLDLTDDKNAALYFPEDIVDGQENLFRIIMRLLVNGQLTAYEYLDGREVFSDQYKLNVRDMLDRYYILYTEAKGSSEKNPRFVIEESDVPTNEVLSYYIIERWEFDNRNNRMRTRVDAICPVLHREGDYMGGEAIKYPMFWVKYSDLRPHLAQQSIFVSDDNNLPSCTYDDFFNLTMYDGEIYKTRNLKNKSMMQLYPDADDMKRAQDSIQARLDNFEQKLWVPDREEIIAAREARERAAAGDTTSVVSSKEKQKKSVRSTARTSTKKSKVKESKPKSSSSSSSSATRSVRRKK